MNVRILVLGILMHRPAHGYEIQQYMQLHEVERWADILAGSTYHALKKMREEGLVEVVRVEFEGKRSREVYAITEPGKVAFRELLLGAWQSPQPSVPLNWYVTLPFWTMLEQSTLLGAIAAQIADMKLEFHCFETEAVSALEPMPDPFVDLVFANVRAHYQANLTFLEGLQERIGQMGTLEPMPLVLPPLEELLEKFPHLKERMKAEPRKGVTRDPSKRIGQARNLQATIAQGPTSTNPKAKNSKAKNSSAQNSSSMSGMEPSEQEEAV